jgi:hypothetical protein
MCLSTSEFAKNCRRYKSPLRITCTLRKKSKTKLYIDTERKGETKTW